MAVNLSDLRKIVYKSVEDIYTPTSDENVRVINMGTNANFDIYVQVGDNHATFKITDSEIETITGILGSLQYAVIDENDPVNPEDTRSKLLVVKVPAEKTLRTVINIHSDIGTVNQDGIYPGSLYIGLNSVSTATDFSELNSSNAVAIYPRRGNYIYENSNAIFNDITSRGDATLTRVTISESLNVNDSSSVTFGDQVDFSVGGQGTVTFGNNTSISTKGNIEFNGLDQPTDDAITFISRIPSQFSEIITNDIKIDGSIQFPDGSSISTGSDSILKSNIVRVFGASSETGTTPISELHRTIILNPFNTPYNPNTKRPTNESNFYTSAVQAMIEVGRASLIDGNSASSISSVDKSRPFLHLDEQSIQLATSDTANVISIRANGDSNVDIQTSLSTFSFTSGKPQGTTTISGGSVATGTLTASTSATISGMTFNSQGIRTNNKPITTGTASITSGSVSTWTLSASTSASLNGMTFNSQGITTNNKNINAGTGKLTAGTASINGMTFDSQGITTNNKPINAGTSSITSGSVSTGTLTASTSATISGMSFNNSGITTNNKNINAGTGKLTAGTASINGMTFNSQGITTNDKNINVGTGKLTAGTVTATNVDMSNIRTCSVTIVNAAKTWKQKVVGSDLVFTFA